MNAHPQFGTVTSPSMSERRVALIGAVLVAIGPSSMALFTPAMPEIVRAFGTTDQMVKLTLTFYFAGFAFAQLICGPLSDGWGRRPVTITFMGIYCGASAIALVAPNIETLVFARFMQGVGAAAGVAISRAVVRDLFTRDQSARIMNLIGMILAVAPAVAPTLGGLTMELFGWHAIFVLMFAAGAGIAITVYVSLRETVTRDLSRIQPKALIRSYSTLLKSRYFLYSAIVVGGTTGALYAQATALPFILMNRVGMTPSQFGFGMLMQSGSYFVGNLVVRALMKRMHAHALVPIGLCGTAIGITSLFFMLHIYEPSYLSVMVPIGISTFGMAFIMPAMTTASLAPFPQIAGAASAMAGFFQMGSGMLGGLIIALMPSPVTGLATIIPIMGVISIVAWFLWRRLPEPVLANIKTNAVPTGTPPS